MAIYGVFDYDFFTYENVVPNLECAKLITYYRNHNHIAVLVPTLNPAPYTTFYIRKEYDDGIYPSKIFEDNCLYGGRAFNPNKYIPLARDIENTIPDMSIYRGLEKNFGKQNVKLSRILNCAHMRLAPDSKNLYPMQYLKKYFTGKKEGIFLHDYDLASLHCINLIKELQNSRRYKERDEIRPYPVGNKFPINIHTPSELKDWLQIVTIPNCFSLEYFGLIPDSVLAELCETNKRMALQIFYNVTAGCSSENQFFIERLPKIFLQTLFLRKNNIKILLTYDESFLVTKELKDFIKLLNCWLSFKYNYMPFTKKQTLYWFCKYTAKFRYLRYDFKTVTVSTEEARDIFSYVRENNYNLFKQFYEVENVYFKGGELVSDWE